MDLSAEVCGKYPFSACFLRPQGAILILFPSKCSRVDFHQDYCKDFKIKAENLDMILAEKRR